jgi:SAM-dependent methyltransferase
MSESTHAIDTSKRFGFQWDLHREFHPHYREQFLQWIAPLDEQAFVDKDVLDAGCGMGRNSRWAAEFGARTITGVDFSELAIDSAREILSDFPNARVQRASLYDIEDEETYDLCFSVGVIHHLEFPRRAVEKLIQALRPGGRLVLWLYGFEGNELWARTFKLIHPVLRRLPPKALHTLAHLFAAPLYLLLKLPLPKSPYLKAVARYPYSHTHLIVHDQLVPEIAIYYKRADVEELVRDLPVSECAIYHNRGYSWTVVCTK